MNYFFIDMENVGGSGLGDVRVVDIGDSVYLLYSQICKEIPLDVVMKLTTVKDTVFKCIKVDVGGKNALDFQLATFLGFVIGENIKEDELNSAQMSDEKRKYFIVSKDTGFDYVCKFWQSKGIDVSRIPNLTGKKEVAKKDTAKKDATTTKKEIVKKAIVKKEVVKKDIANKETTSEEKIASEDIKGEEIKVEDIKATTSQVTDVKVVDTKLEETIVDTKAEDLKSETLKVEITPAELSHEKPEKKKNNSRKNRKNVKNEQSKTLEIIKTSESPVVSEIEQVKIIEQPKAADNGESIEKPADASDSSLVLESETNLASLEDVKKYLSESEKIEEILTVFNKYKTKQAIHNGINSVYKDSKKSGEIYKHLKPLLKEKKKN